MGMSFGGHRKHSNSSCSCVQRVEVVVKHERPKRKLKKLPNPNPNRYIIEDVYTKGGFTMVMVRYPDAVNFEGRKILIFRTKVWDTRTKGSGLDPHFCEDFTGPTARFAPTKEGTHLARRFVEREG